VDLQQRFLSLLEGLEKLDRIKGFFPGLELTQPDVNEVFEVLELHEQR